MGLPATYMRATLNFSDTATGAKAHCVLWYLPTSGTPSITLANIATYANDFKTAFATAVAAALSQEAQLDSVTLKWVQAGTEIEGQNTNGVVAGTVESENLPEEDVLCIQRRTGLQGRTKRGRIFFPFVPAAFEADGELNTTGKAAAAGLAGMVKSTVTANSVSFTPKTLDHKNAVLETVVQAGYITATTSRRDRRFPKQLTSVRV